MRIVLGLLVVCVAGHICVSQSSPGGRIADSREDSPSELGQHGQEALANGRLEEAEKDFRRVLELDPKDGRAYANLGVVYMGRTGSLSLTIS